MPRNWEFQLPTRIQFGCGELDKIGGIAKEIGGSALLVGYRDRRGLQDAYAKTAGLLAEAGLKVTEFFEVPPDPQAELGKVGAEMAVQTGVDLVVGLGGGSVIDAAKGIAVLAKMGGDLWEYTGANPDFRPITDSLPVVAVPTTAGTGTEVTRVAVFTHHGVGSMPGLPVKASIAGPLVWPKVALVDPDLMVGSPAGLTAACAADALGHALEACMSRNANPFSSALAGRAVALIVENMAPAAGNPDDPEPRRPLALASTMAGAAFTVAGVIMTHSIAHALGALLHVPHGRAIAVGTPISLRFNAEQCVDVYAELAHYCGITADSPQERADRFVDRIVGLLESVGLLRPIDVPDDAPDDLAARLARNAFDGTPVPIKLNPRELDEPTLTKLFGELLQH